MTRHTRIIPILVGIYLSSFFHAHARHEPSNIAQLRQNSSLLFIENKGQIIDQYQNQRKDIDAKLVLPGMDVFIGKGQLHYQWTKMLDTTRTDIYRLDVSLINANKNAELVVEDKQDFYENYYLSQCPNGVRAHSYKKITYKNIYPNIDWVLYLKDNVLKYDFVVRSGGDAKNIQLKYEGATDMKINEGSLVVTTPFGQITEQKPYTYIADSKEVIVSDYVLKENILSFKLGTSPNETFIIDPTLDWATYYGGSVNEWMASTASDAKGNVYLSTVTGSSNLATSGAFQMSSINGPNIASSVLIVKFNTSGARLWATYFGSGFLAAYQYLATDTARNVYLSGAIDSIYNGPNWSTPLVQQTKHGGTRDVIVVKFNENGNRVWSTYCGGTGLDEPWGIAASVNGEVYIAGATASVNMATSGAFKTTPTKCFLAKFNPLGVRVWATYFGPAGFATTNVMGLCIDTAKSVFVCGKTSSTTDIATSGSFMPTLSNSQDGFIIKFDKLGQLMWGTYYGGTATDYLTGVSCDIAGNVYGCGYTRSVNGIASGHGSHQSTLLGVDDDFVVKFDVSGQRVWGTYLGAMSLNSSSYTPKIANDTLGDVYVSGSANTNIGISTPGSPQINNAGGIDAYLVKFNTNGMKRWGTYFGGTNEDPSYGVTCSVLGKVYVAGSTRSTSGIATINGFQKNFGGGVYDAYLVQIGQDTIVYIQQLTLDSLGCVGSTIKIDYAVTYPFKSNNIFTIQLSDASGSFASPTIIATINSNLGGTYPWIIPSTIPVGAGYRIRIVSSAPAYISDDNGYNIKISASPMNVLAVANGPVCETDTIKLSASTATANVTWYWNGPGGFFAPQQNASRTPISVADAGDYIVTATANGCSSSDTVNVVVFKTPVGPVVSGNTPICEGDTLRLDADSSVAGTSFNWQGPLSFSSGLKSPVIPGIGAGHAGTYSVVAIVNGCKSTPSTIDVAIKYPPEIKYDIHGNLCLGEKIEFVPDYSDMQAFSWSFGDASVIDSTAYKSYFLLWNTIGNKKIVLNAVGKNGCIGEKEKTITVHDNLHPKITTPETDVCSADKVELNTTESAEFTYKWSPEEYFSENNKPRLYATIPHATNVKLRVADIWGCIGADSISFTTRPCCIVNLPTVFTPNDDGKNDKFRIITSGHHEIQKFIVVNRWGEVIFKTNNEAEGWDGTCKGQPMELGAYYYYLKYKCSNEEVFEQKGDFILVR